MTIASVSRHILSVWLRRLATDRIERSVSPAPAETPLVVAASIKSARRITALNDAAAKLGLRAGMALADARARYPALRIADAAPQADLALLATIADWCGRYTPLVGFDPPDGLLLDISGCAHLFGGETELCRDISRRLRAQGFHVRVAVATVSSSLGRRALWLSGVVPKQKRKQRLHPCRSAPWHRAGDRRGVAQAGLKQVGNPRSSACATRARFGENSSAA